ncbi:helix-turn-helix domain-containing protein [Duganella sp. BJB476]|uniref:MarR family transcriptional regulator n=1 Tax=Duganella sp. BJB476 TaxID=1871176 RepID=UPI000E357AF5|nr:helix-turn-helix domain-containing protein [Duganella sp. BJB476]RFP28715.1 MarR family transcriptional regulator [Duganella sp. BJB476]
MTTLARKKVSASAVQVPPVQDRQRPVRGVPPGAAGVGAVIPGSAIERALNLGEGYYVLKFRFPKADKRGGSGPADAPVEFLEHGVPTIDPAAIDALLNRGAGHFVQTPGGTGARRGRGRRPQADNEAFTAKVNLESVNSRQVHLAEGRLLTSADLCERLGISRQALSKAVKEQRMFYVDGLSGSQLYPAFFATGKAERRKLEQVSQALGDLPGPSKWDFFISPKLSLNERSPVAALADGDLPKVLAAAGAFRGR